MSPPRERTGMGETLDAELVVETDLLKAGRISLQDSAAWRSLWFVIFYLGFSMPFAFLGYWGRTLGMAEFGLDKYTVAAMFMVVQIPFFLRPFFALPVDLARTMPFGRRRSWMLLGTLGHCILLLPLAFIEVGSAPWLWVAILVLALLPRVLAEQAVAAMMSDSVPDLGRVNSMINLAYRGGGHLVILLMGWWIAGGDASPFVSDGQTDFGMVRLATFGILLATMAAGIGITLLMREPEPLQRKQVVAHAEDVPYVRKVLGAMRTRTAWLVLLGCFVLPLGDGFEAWFSAYLVEVAGMDGAEITAWWNLFALVNYLGLAGPLISDYIGRTRALRMYGIGSLACYVALGGAMLGGVTGLPVILIWIPTLVLTDWMMFTFFTTFADVADPRMGATHMGVYQTTQAISATFVMVGLGGMLLWVSSDAYGLLFLLAGLGPLAGLWIFAQLKLDEAEWGTDRIDLGATFTSLQGRMRNAAPMTVVAMLLLCTVAGGIGPKMLLDFDEERVTESWSGDWNQTILTVEAGQTISNTGSHIVTLDVPGSVGGLLGGHFWVRYEGDSTPLVEPSWEVAFDAPDPVNLSDGENVSTWRNQQSWEGQLDIQMDGEGPELANFSTRDDVAFALEDIRAQPWFGYGRGSWTLKVTMTDSGGFPSNQASFTLNLTLFHLVPPRADPDANELNLTQTIELIEHRYGTAIGVLLGFPLLLATPVLGWVARQNPEEWSD